jgi:hypothetical protein
MSEQYPGAAKEAMIGTQPNPRSISGVKVLPTAFGFNN